MVGGCWVWGEGGSLPQGAQPPEPRGWIGLGARAEPCAAPGPPLVSVGKELCTSLLPTPLLISTFPMSSNEAALTKAGGREPWCPATHPGC